MEDAFVECAEDTFFVPATAFQSATHSRLFGALPSNR